MARTAITLVAPSGWSWTTKTIYVNAVKPGTAVTARSVYDAPNGGNRLSYIAYPTMAGCRPVGWFERSDQNDRGALYMIPATFNQELWWRAYDGPYAIYLGYEYARARLCSGYGAGAELGVIYRDIALGRCYGDAGGGDDSVITHVPVPTRFGHKFLGYFTKPSGEGEKYITSAGLIKRIVSQDTSADIALYAAWTRTGGGTTFGDVRDYFRMESDALVPIASNDGRELPQIAREESTGAAEHKAAMRSTVAIVSPSTTYLVVRDTTVEVDLGRGFAGTSAETGYMVTSVTIETAAGQAPRVTVDAVANEGVDGRAFDAINRFKVSIPVKGRSAAQNLLDAIDCGGGCLASYTLKAECQPVVLMAEVVEPAESWGRENGAVKVVWSDRAAFSMPVASDVVGGVLRVDATMVSRDAKSSPVSIEGFKMVSMPEERSDSSYRTIRLRAEKDMKKE